MKSAVSSKSYSWPLKFTALFVSICILLLDVHAYAQIANSPQTTDDRPQIVDHEKVLERGLSTMDYGLKNITIPEELGTIDEVYRSSNAESQSTVIFIQDAHNSFEAQENIAAIIESVVKNHGVKTVFTEGYEGKVPSDDYFGHIENAEEKKIVSRFLMDKLRVGGAEYAHINRTSEFELLGAEDMDLYLQNLETYQEAASKQEMIKKDLEAMEQKVKKLTDQHFPRKLKKWMKLRKRFDQQKLDLLDYVKRTWDISDEVERDNYPSLELILNPTDDLEEIQPKQVFSEIEQLENEIADTYLKSNRDRKLFDYHKNIQILKRLNAMEINSSEYRALAETLKQINTQEIAQFVANQSGRSILLSKAWEKGIRHAIRFYGLAQARETAVEETLKKSGHEISVLVFGGFHKEGFKQILKDNGYSYLIVTPNMTKISEKHEIYYRELMQMGPRSVELPSILARAAVQLRGMAARSETRFQELIDRTLTTVQNLKTANRSLTVSEMDVAWNSKISSRSEVRANRIVFSDDQMSLNDVQRIRDWVIPFSGVVNILEIKSRLMTGTEDGDIFGLENFTLFKEAFGNPRSLLGELLSNALRGQDPEGVFQGEVELETAYFENLVRVRITQSRVNDSDWRRLVSNHDAVKGYGMGFLNKHITRQSGGFTRYHDGGMGRGLETFKNVSDEFPALLVYARDTDSSKPVTTTLYLDTNPRSKVRTHRDGDASNFDAREVYDQIARDYDSKWGENVQAELLKHRQSFLEQLPDDGIVLDVGSVGRDAKFFQENGRDVMGINISSGQIKLALERHPDLTIQEGDLRSLGEHVEENSLAGIWDNRVFLHFSPDEAKQVLQNYHRALISSKGLLFLQVKRGDGEVEEYDQDYDLWRYMKYYQQDELIELVHSQGFDVLESFVDVDTDTLKQKARDRDWISIFARPRSEVRLRWVGDNHFGGDDSDKEPEEEPEEEPVQEPNRAMEFLSGIPFGIAHFLVWIYAVSLAVTLWARGDTLTSDELTKANYLTYSISVLLGFQNYLVFRTLAKRLKSSSVRFFDKEDLINSLRASADLAFVLGWTGPFVLIVLMLGRFLIADRPAESTTWMESVPLQFALIQMIFLGPLFRWRFRKDQKEVNYRLDVRSEVRNLDIQMIHSERAPHAVGPYPHAVKSRSHLFLSGVGPRQRDQDEIPGSTINSVRVLESYDLEVQMRATFQNIGWILEESGASWDQIKEASLYVIDLEENQAIVERIWQEYFPPDQFSLKPRIVGVNRLPTPISFEMDAIFELEKIGSISSDRTHYGHGRGLGPGTHAQKDNFEGKVRKTFRQVETFLRHTHNSPTNIVKVVVYVNDMKFKGIVNRVWREIFPDPRLRPARTMVELEEGKMRYPIKVDITVLNNTNRSELRSDSNEFEKRIEIPDLEKITRGINQDRFWLDVEDIFLNLWELKWPVLVSLIYGFSVMMTPPGQISVLGWFISAFMFAGWSLFGLKNLLTLVVSGGYWLTGAVRENDRVFPYGYRSIRHYFITSKVQQILQSLLDEFAAGPFGEALTTEQVELEDFQDHEENHYDLLEISQNANPSQIEKSYRRLARAYHPDLNPNDEDALLRFKQIQNAYETLTDDTKKADYDRTLSSNQRDQTQKQFNFSDHEILKQGYVSVKVFEENFWKFYSAWQTEGHKPNLSPWKLGHTREEMYQVDEIYKREKGFYVFSIFGVGVLIRDGEELKTFLETLAKQNPEFHVQIQNARNHGVGYKRGRFGGKQRFINLHDGQDVRLELKLLNLLSGRSLIPSSLKIEDQFRSEVREVERVSLDNVSDEVLDNIAKRLIWLSSWMIYTANKKKKNAGGHYSAATSMTHILLGAYLARQPNDLFFVKPHALPMEKAIQLMLDLLHEDRDQARKIFANLRQELIADHDLDGTLLSDIEAIESLTTEGADQIRTLIEPLISQVREGKLVEGFSAYHSERNPGLQDAPAGSVGLNGSHASSLAAVHKYHADQGRNVPEDSHMIAFLGDGETAEGSAREMLELPAEYQSNNVTHIIDFNQFSLDGAASKRSYRVLKGMYQAAGWNVVDLKWGRKFQRAVEEVHGYGSILLDIFNRLTNEEYHALVQMALKDDTKDNFKADLKPILLKKKRGRNAKEAVEALFERYSGQELYELLIDLGGHDARLIKDAIDSSRENKKRPTLIIAWTLKGYGIDVTIGDDSGHKKFLDGNEFEALRVRSGIDENHPLPFFDDSTAEGQVLAQTRDFIRSSLEQRRGTRQQNKAAENHQRPESDTFPKRLPIDKPGQPPLASLPTHSGALVLFNHIDEIANGNQLDGWSSEQLSAFQYYANRHQLVSGDVHDTSSPHARKSLYGPPLTRNEQNLRTLAEESYGIKKQKVNQSWQGRHWKMKLAEQEAVHHGMMLAKSPDFFGLDLYPIVSLYDKFIFDRALDHWGFAQYWGARMMAFGDVSGSGLASEGPLHQSYKTMVIALMMPNVIGWEPSFADELEYILPDAIRRMVIKDDVGRLIPYIRASVVPVKRRELWKRLATQKRYKKAFEEAGASSQSEKMEVMRELWSQDLLRGGYRLVDFSGFTQADRRDYLKNVLKVEDDPKLHILDEIKDDAHGYFFDYTPDYNVVNIITSGPAVTQALEASDKLLRAGIFANVIVMSSPDLVVGELGKNITDPSYLNRLDPKDDRTHPHLRYLIPLNERVYTPLIGVGDGSSIIYDLAASRLGVTAGSVDLGITKNGRSVMDFNEVWQYHDITWRNIVTQSYQRLMARELGRGTVGQVTQYADEIALLGTGTLVPRSEVRSNDTDYSVTLTVSNKFILDVDGENITITEQSVPFDHQVSVQSFEAFEAGETRSIIVGSSSEADFKTWGDAKQFQIKYDKESGWQIRSLWTDKVLIGDENQSQLDQNWVDLNTFASRSELRENGNDDIPPTINLSELSPEKRTVEELIGTHPFEVKAFFGMSKDPMNVAYGRAESISSFEIPSDGMLRFIGDDVIKSITQYFRERHGDDFARILWPYIASFRHIQDEDFMVAVVRGFEAYLEAELTVEEKASLLLLKSGFATANVFSPNEWIQGVMNHLKGVGNNYFDLLFYINSVRENPTNNPRVTKLGLPSSRIESVDQIESLHFHSIKEGPSAHIWMAEVKIREEPKPIRFVINIPKDGTFASLAVVNANRILSHYYEVSPDDAMEVYGIAEEGMPVMIGEWVEGSEELHLYGEGEGKVFHVWEDQSVTKEAPRSEEDSAKIWRQLARSRTLFWRNKPTGPDKHKPLINRGDYVIYDNETGEPQAVLIWDAGGDSSMPMEDNLDEDITNSVMSTLLWAEQNHHKDHGEIEIILLQHPNLVLEGIVDGFLDSSKSEGEARDQLRTIFEDILQVLEFELLGDLAESAFGDRDMIEQLTGAGLDQRFRLTKEVLENYLEDYKVIVGDILEDTDFGWEKKVASVDYEAKTFRFEDNDTDFRFSQVGIRFEEVRETINEITPESEREPLLIGRPLSEVLGEHPFNLNVLSAVENENEFVNSYEHGSNLSQISHLMSYGLFQILDWDTILSIKAVFSDKYGHPFDTAILPFISVFLNDDDSNYLKNVIHNVQFNRGFRILDDDIPALIGLRDAIREAEVVTGHQTLSAITAYLSGDTDDYEPLLNHIRHVQKNPSNNERFIWRTASGKSIESVDAIETVNLYSLKFGAYTSVWRVEVLFKDASEEPVEFVINAARDKTDAAEAVRRAYGIMKHNFELDPKAAMEVFGFGEVDGISILAGEWVHESLELHLYPEGEGEIFNVWEDFKDVRATQISEEHSREVWKQIIRSRLQFGYEKHQDSRVHSPRINNGDYVYYLDPKGNPHAILIWDDGRDMDKSEMVVKRNQLALQILKAFLIHETHDDSPIRSDIFLHVNQPELILEAILETFQELDGKFDDESIRQLLGQVIDETIPLARQTSKASVFRTQLNETERVIGAYLGRKEYIPIEETLRVGDVLLDTDFEWEKTVASIDVTNGTFRAEGSDIDLRLNQVGSRFIPQPRAEVRMADLEIQNSRSEVRSDEVELDLKDKKVLVLPGGGLIEPGMGKALYDVSPAYRRVMALASRTLGYDLADKIFTGTPEELDNPVYDEPAIIISLYALYKALEVELNYPPEEGAIYGLSRGSVTAAMIAGSISFEDGVRLAQLYGEELAKVKPGKMVQIIGIEESRVEEIADQFGLDIGVDLGTMATGDRVLTLSGEKAVVDEAYALLENEPGLKKAVHLPNGSVASHSRVIKPAVDVIEAFVQTIEVRDPNVPLISNIDGSVLDTAEKVRHELSQHLLNRIRFPKVVETLAKSKTNQILELGTRRRAVLSRFMQLPDAEFEYVDAPAKGEPKNLRKYATNNQLTNLPSFMSDMLEARSEETRNITDINGDSEAVREHWLKTNRMIREDLNSRNQKGGTTLLFGLGNGSEFDSRYKKYDPEFMTLTELAKRFDRVVIFEIDAETARQTLDREVNEQDLRNKFEIHDQDFTDLLAPLARKLKKVIDISSADDVIENLTDAISEVQIPIRDYAEYEADYVIASVVISQLTNSLRRYVLDLLDKKFPRTNFTSADGQGLPYIIAISHLSQDVQHAFIFGIRKAIEADGRAFLSWTKRRFETQMGENGQEVPFQERPMTLVAMDRILRQIFEIHDQQEWTWTALSALENPVGIGHSYPINAVLLSGKVYDENDIPKPGEHLPLITIKHIDPSRSEMRNDDDPANAEYVVNLYMVRDVMIKVSGKRMTLMTEDAETGMNIKPFDADSLKKVIVLGRSDEDEVDFIVKHGFVSSKHAEFRYDESEGWQIRDISRNSFAFTGYENDAPEKNKWIPLSNYPFRSEVRISEANPDMKVSVDYSNPETIFGPIVRKKIVIDERQRKLFEEQFQSQIQEGDYYLIGTHDHPILLAKMGHVNQLSWTKMNPLRIVYEQLIEQGGLTWPDYLLNIELMGIDAERVHIMEYYPLVRDPKSSEGILPFLKQHYERVDPITQFPATGLYPKTNHLSTLNIKNIDGRNFVLKVPIRQTFVTDEDKSVIQTINSELHEAAYYLVDEMRNDGFEVRVTNMTNGRRDIPEPQQYLDLKIEIMNHPQYKGVNFTVERIPTEDLGDGKFKYQYAVRIWKLVNRKPPAFEVEDASDLLVAAHDMWTRFKQYDVQENRSEVRTDDYQPLMDPILNRAIKANFLPDIFNEFIDWGVAKFVDANKDDLESLDLYRGDKQERQAVINELTPILKQLKRAKKINDLKAQYRRKINERFDALVDPVVKAAAKRKLTEEEFETLIEGARIKFDPFTKEHKSVLAKLAGAPANIKAAKLSKLASRIVQAVTFTEGQFRTVDFKNRFADQLTEDAAGDFFDGIDESEEEVAQRIADQNRYFIETINQDVASINPADTGRTQGQISNEDVLHFAKVHKLLNADKEVDLERVEELMSDEYNYDEDQKVWIRKSDQQLADERKEKEAHFINVVDQNVDESVGEISNHAVLDLAKATKLLDSQGKGNLKRVIELMNKNYDFDKARDVWIRKSMPMRRSEVRTDESLDNGFPRTDFDEARLDELPAFNRGRVQAIHAFLEPKQVFNLRRLILYIGTQPDFFHAMFPDEDLRKAIFLALKETLSHQLLRVLPNLVKSSGKSIPIDIFPSILSIGFNIDNSEWERIVEMLRDQHEVTDFEQLKAFILSQPDLFKTIVQDADIGEFVNRALGINRSEVRKTAEVVYPVRSDVQVLGQGIAGKFIFGVDLTGGFTVDQVKDLEMLAHMHPKNLSFVFYNVSKIQETEIRNQIESLQNDFDVNRIQIFEGMPSDQAFMLPGSVIQISKGQEDSTSLDAFIPRNKKRLRARYLQDETGIAPVALLYALAGIDKFKNMVLDRFNMDSALLGKVQQFFNQFVFARSA